MLNTLKRIGEELNKAGICWGIGASIVLKQFGLAEQPRDIDIMVDSKDIDRVDLILSQLGEKKCREKVDVYATKYFYEYRIDGMDIDVMSGLRINHDEGVFEYLFDAASVASKIMLNDVAIPMMALEDWYVIYQLIPGREAKVERIERHILESGDGDVALLKRSLKFNLPKKVCYRIEKLCRAIEKQV